MATQLERVNRGWQKIWLRHRYTGSGIRLPRRPRSTGSPPRRGLSS